MDVLSDVLAVQRTGRPRSMLLGWDGAFAQEFAEVPGAMGFQVILRGSPWLLPPAGSAPVQLAAGDVVFRPHGRAHALASTPEAAPAPCEVAPGPPPRGQEVVTVCGAYEIDPAQTHPLVHDLPELIHLAPTDDLRAAVGLLSAELSRPRLGSDAAVPALLDLLLLLLLRSWYDGSARPTGFAAALRDPVVAVALQAMHADPGRGWTVASLAAEAGVSRAPFARRFRGLVGRPPLEYLTWWRMTSAARLLRESDETVGRVARRVGYGSEFAFATAFRRRFGTPPGRYRRGP
jgi:AraC-like DNA-binding protein